ncbi:hypothetical protein MACH17_06240 [Phaeobacter inhibens]|uniref:ATP-binding response regulator n=1 Tax=Phaeobacter inhibens TaxID=221822 RepID=UPI00276FAAAB|nr:hybrid sensor histidine kinase/response regulator [Phaeobacter inhibens]GLO69107.1 hypothetical protein MACH17_06240 [Phaeobacter inhibens]
MAFLPIPASDYPADRAKLFARAPTKIYFGHILSFAVLAYLAHDVLPTWLIVVWAAWEMAGTPYLLHRLTRSVGSVRMSDEELEIWQTKLHTLFAAVGVSWGGFVALGLDIENPVHFSIQMAIVAGATSSAARSLSIFRFASYLYIIPFNGLLALRIILLGGDYVLLGILVIVFLGMLARLANDTSDELSDYLATKEQNLDLARKFERAAQDATQANLAKSHFLVQANHDLRQPIHAIGLLSASLREEDLSLEGHRTLDTVDSSVESLSGLFKSLLNISSIETGTIKVKIETFSLNDIINQVVRQALPEAKEHGTVLRAVHTSLWVETDKALLRSILQNLVFNAVNYARGSTVLIGVRRKANSAELHVIDQGIGMSPELQSRVFHDFERGNPDGPNRVEGWGLGLAIVKKTTQIIGLTVGLKSAPGTGTSVAIGGIAYAQEKSQSLAPPLVLSANDKKQNIMIVDDNSSIVTSLELLLPRWGYETTAYPPDSETAPSCPPDVLIMDYHLNGELSGLQLAQKLAEGFDMTVPTLIISGTLSPEIEASAAEIGYWTLQKPVAPSELRSTLIAMKSD